MSKFTFLSSFNSVNESSEKVLGDLADMKLDESTLFDIRLCFEEAFINAVKHGHKGDTNFSIEVDVIKKDNSIEIVLCDSGDGFDMDECEDPTTDENITKTSGRGVFLIKKLMDEVSYEESSNCLHMKKNIK